MHKLLGVFALGVLWFGGGCSLTPSVDELPPMPPAAPEPIPEPEAGTAGLANGMAEPEPTAIAEPADQDQDLWARLREGYGLPRVDNPRVEEQRVFYTRHPVYFTRVTTRAERYLKFIVDETEARHMPTELALLPVVESAFDPFAYSHGRAAGPWQFIPSTGQHFGLRQDWWYDGRRDIIASTRAALTYLQQLADRFDGDWLLALASYNAGAGTILRAQKRNEAAGKPTDFWSLDLPTETTAYVPKLLAVADIVRNPKQYGVALHPITDVPYFISVDTGGQLDLTQAARLAEVPMEELYLLNPGFNRWATAPAGPHRLLVPADKADRFKAGLASLPAGQRMSWQRYTIARGDNLQSIARRHRTKVQVLREINHLKGNTIIAGKTLLIPQSARGSAAPAGDGAKPRGRRLAHKVDSGDTLWDLARHYQVSVRDLAQWNDLDPKDPLRVGQTLQVWSGNESGDQGQRSEMVRQVRYSVRHGDSLYTIANRFNVSVNDIRSWNNTLSKRRYLRPGDRVTLFVDIRDAP
ncbi:LysM peptidoglycan-binding domain-containing protein [Alloalcanivorax xenomutans]|uniref:LysM peptidoglycan-binding domain-containing protein n=1 Tax=Alloalcanivorax xenomutans TaxID=1094342 RepID=UPI00054ED251